jgi:hypothetical protein
MSSATLANNMDRAVALVYPPAVQRLGKAEIAAALRREFVAQPQPDYRVIGLECAMPVQMSEAGGLQLALLPVFLTANTSKGLFKNHAFYLGISANQGLAWTFLAIDDKQAKGAGLKQYLPAGLGSIAVPPPRMPLMMMRQP